jgi:hypothetical protein
VRHESNKEYALDALHGFIVVGAQRLAADRARAAIITLRWFERPGRRREVIAPASAGERLAARIIGERQHCAPPFALHMSSPMFSFPGTLSEAISWRLAT